MKYSPQAIDQILNDQLDADVDAGKLSGISSFGCHAPIPAFPLDRYLPAAKRTGRPRRTITGRKLPRATLDQIERP